MAWFNTDQLSAQDEVPLEHLYILGYGPDDLSDCSSQGYISSSSQDSFAFEPLCNDVLLPCDRDAHAGEENQVVVNAGIQAWGSVNRSPLAPLQQTCYPSGGEEATSMVTETSKPKPLKREREGDENERSAKKPRSKEKAVVVRTHWQALIQRSSEVVDVLPNDYTTKLRSKRGKVVRILEPDTACLGPYVGCQSFPTVIDVRHPVRGKSVPLKLQLNRPEFKRSRQRVFFAWVTSGAALPDAIKVVDNGCMRNGEKVLGHHESTMVVEVVSQLAGNCPRSRGKIEVRELTHLENGKFEVDFTLVQLCRQARTRNHLIIARREKKQEKWRLSIGGAIWAFNDRHDELKFDRLFQDNRFRSEIHSDLTDVYGSSILADE